MQVALLVLLQARQISVMNGNITVKSWPIAIGKSTTPTPVGTYQIISKIPNPGGVLGAMWLGLSAPDYGIHGTNNPQSIGKMVSNGCIRMHNRDVLELARLVQVGTNLAIRR